VELKISLETYLLNPVYSNSTALYYVKPPKLSLQTKGHGYTAVGMLVHELMTTQTCTGFQHIENINPSKELQIKS
jgi:hypothetical protein